MNKKLSAFRKLKFIADFIIALIVIVLLSPLFIIISIAICIDSKGNPFFLQKRLGLFGKPYKIIKFRTMVLNAENMGDKMRIIDKEDARITKVGKFLRNYSLDELPQFFNILKGDMALIGPRPCLTYHPYDGADNFPEWSKPRFLIRPGITGLAQVKVRNAATWDERMKYDIEYINNFSLIQDIKIIWLTIVRIFKPENMYLTDEQ